MVIDEMLCGENGTLGSQGWRKQHAASVLSRSYIWRLRKSSHEEPAAGISLWFTHPGTEDILLDCLSTVSGLVDFS
jgi:hypothetical protein